MSRDQKDKKEGAMKSSGREASEAGESCQKVLKQKIAVFSKKKKKGKEVNVEEEKGTVWRI